MLILLAALLAALVIVAAKTPSGADVYLLLMAIGTTGLHVQLARVGWFYRYEAYLLILGAAIAGVMAAARPPLTRRPGAALHAAALAALLVVAGVPFLSRGINAWRNI